MYRFHIYLLRIQTFFKLRSKAMNIFIINYNFRSGGPSFILLLKAVTNLAIQYLAIYLE